MPYTGNAEALLQQGQNEQILFDESIPSDFGASRQLEEKVVKELHHCGCPERDVFDVKLVLEEGFSNAIKHAHKSIREKLIRFRAELFVIPLQNVILQGVDGESQSKSINRLLALQIHDQDAKGFDPTQVPDPRAPANLENVGGRGLLLIKQTCMRADWTNALQWKTDQNIIGTRLRMLLGFHAQ